MSTPGFWFLGQPNEGLATLDHEGQRFVPIFASMEDLQRFGQRCPEQVSGYHVYKAAEPADIGAFLEVLAGASVHVGIPGNAPDGSGAAEGFTILEPAALARALAEAGNAPR
jgi:hypothetical protein